MGNGVHTVKYRYGYSTKTYVTALFPGKVCCQSMFVQIWQFLFVKCLQGTCCTITMTSNFLSSYTNAQSACKFVCRECAWCLSFPCSCCCQAAHVHLRRHSRLPAHLLWSACHGPCDRHLAGSQAPGGWPLFHLLLLTLHDCSWGTACGGWRVPHPWRRYAAVHILSAQAVETLSRLLTQAPSLLNSQDVCGCAGPPHMQVLLQKVSCCSGT